MEYGVQTIENDGTSLVTSYPDELTQTLWCQIEDGGTEYQFDERGLRRGAIFNISVLVRWNDQVARWFPALMRCTVVGEPVDAGYWAVIGRTLPISGDRRRFVNLTMSRQDYPITGV